MISPTHASTADVPSAVVNTVSCRHSLVVMGPRKSGKPPKVTVSRFSAFDPAPFAAKKLIA